MESYEGLAERHIEAANEAKQLIEKIVKLTQARSIHWPRLTELWTAQQDGKQLTGPELAEVVLRESHAAGFTTRDEVIQAIHDLADVEYRSGWFDPSREQGPITRQFRITFAGKHHIQIRGKLKGDCGIGLFRMQYRTWACAGWNRVPLTPMEEKAIEYFLSSLINEKPTP